MLVCDPRQPSGDLSDRNPGRPRPRRFHLRLSAGLQPGNNFAYVGARATGTGAGSFLLVPPGWSGEEPADARVIRLPTIVSIVGLWAVDGEIAWFEKLRTWLRGGAGLVRSEQGSLTIHMQHDEPDDPTARANWLPTPAGPFRPLLRIYEPDEAVFDGRFELPAIRKV